IYYKGDPDFNATLGNDFIEADGAKYIELLRDCVAKHVPECATALGAAYNNGEYVTANPSRAVEYYQLAMEWGGEETAANNLGMQYEDGTATPVDLAKATHWYIFAAKLGYKDALVRLGQLLASGRARFVSGHSPADFLQDQLYRLAAQN